MTCTIGRCSLADDPYDVSADGDRLSFSIDVVGSSVDHLKALRQQLLGLVDNADEPVIPFTWSEDPSLDGHYRVRSVSVGSSEVMLSTGYIPGGAKVTLGRIPGLANPWLEVTTQSVVRTNAHLISAPYGVIGHWAAGSTVEATPAFQYPTAMLASSRSRPVSDSTSVRLSAIINQAPVARTAYRYSVPAAEFYYGACRVELLYGSTWHEVTNRNIKSSRVWRISNGMVRLTSANGATSGKIEIWDDATLQWEGTEIRHNYVVSGSPTVAGIGFGNGATQQQLTIHRLDPAQAVVSVLGGSGVTYTYSIQRAAHLVGISWASFDNTTFTCGLEFTNATASTAISGGMRATANDANGNRVCFFIPTAFTTGGGAIYPSAAASRGTAAVGVEWGGSGAAVGDRAQDLSDQFYAAAAMRQRVILR